MYHYFSSTAPRVPLLQTALFTFVMMSTRFALQQGPSECLIAATHASMLLVNNSVTSHDRVMNKYHGNVSRVERTFRAVEEQRLY